MRVFPSKYEAELVTVRWNFADVLLFGSTLVSGAVTVGVASGVDDQADLLVDGSSTVINTTLTQQLIGGIAGVIYSLTATVMDTEGNTHIKRSIQAVISNLGGFSFGPATELTLTGDLTDGDEGISYTDTLFISGGTPPYSRATIVAGSMPAWMSMNIVGDSLIFTGNPDEGGISTFTPQIRDFAGLAARSPQEIIINNSELSIIGDIPDGLTSVPVNYQYTINGGIPPYTVDITTGLLPTQNNSDIDDEGFVSGAYGVVGEYSWTVRVIDSLTSVVTLNDSCNILPFSLYLFQSSVTYYKGNFTAFTTAVNFTSLNNADVACTDGNKILICRLEALGIRYAAALMDGADSWTDSLYLPAGGNIQSINHFSGYWWAGMVGNVQRSEDGINFTNFYLGSGYQVYAIDGIGGFIITPQVRSEDFGVSWELPFSGYNPEANKIRFIANNGSFFIAVGTGNTIFYAPTSMDGWSTIDSPFEGTSDFTGIAYASGYWVVGNSAGDAAYSNDINGPWQYLSGFDRISYVSARNGYFVVAGRDNTTQGRVLNCFADMNWTEVVNVNGAVFGITAAIRLDGA